MTRLAEIQARIDGMGELKEIIGAMRSLAGVRLQEAQRALPAVRRYAEAVATALAGTLPLLPELAPVERLRHEGQALVLYAAEHGFVGGFNERLVEAAEKALKPNDALFVLGTRGAALAIERGRRVTWMRPMATRASNAPQIVRPLSLELYAHIARGDVSRVEAIFGRRREGAAPEIERRLILPLDLTLLAPMQPRHPPLHNLEPIALHETLMAEYVFALLAEAAVESIASENAARLAAMQSARDNISKKLEELRRDEREARQTEITAELLDLVSGVNALEEGVAPLPRPATSGEAAAKPRKPLSPSSAAP